MDPSVNHYVYSLRASSNLPSYSVFSTLQDTFAFVKAFTLRTEVVIVSTTSAINELFACFGRLIVIESREIRFAKACFWRQATEVGYNTKSNKQQSYLIVHRFCEMQMHASCWFLNS